MSSRRPARRAKLIWAPKPGSTVARKIAEAEAEAQQIEERLKAAAVPEVVALLNMADGAAPGQGENMSAGLVVPRDSI